MGNPSAERVKSLLSDKCTIYDFTIQLNLRFDNLRFTILQSNLIYDFTIYDLQFIDYLIIWPFYPPDVSR